MVMMNKDNYPNLYSSASAASRKAQYNYLRLNKMYLGSLVLGSMTSMFTVIESEALNTCLYTVMAVVLVVGLLILWVIRAKRDDKTWFDGRAIAESVKTITWRFMMRVQPFHEDCDADSSFLARLREIREARPHLGRHLAAEMAASGSAITSFMREKRSSSLEERRNFYAKARIHDQKTWYAIKAKSNSNAGAKCFRVTMILQVLIMILAIVQAICRGLRINPIPIVTTYASAIAAWTQMKRHNELAQSYALAAQELEELEAVATNQISGNAFTQLVEQAENSISREHTLWCARRDIPLIKVTGINPKVRG